MAELSFTFLSGGSGGGLTLAEHELIDSLVHNVSEDTTQQIVRDSQGRLSEYNIVTDPGGVAVRSTSITRDASGLVTQVVEKQHDDAGTVIQTLTTTITRVDGKVTTVQTAEVGP